MATASAVVTRRGNDSFRGLFSDTWSVVCTLNAGSLVDGAGETDDVTVPGVALGDMVLCASLAVDLVGLTVTGYVSACQHRQVSHPKRIRFNCGLGISHYGHSYCSYGVRIGGLVPPFLFKGFNGYFSLSSIW